MTRTTEKSKAETEGERFVEAGLDAICSGDVEFFRRTLVAVRSLPSDRKTTVLTAMLRAAVRSRQTSAASKAVDLLVASGADPDGEELGWSGFLTAPLHLAAVYDNLDVARALLAAGAAVDREDLEGKTPLRYACERGLCGFADLLLSSGADPTRRAADGESPIGVSRGFVATRVEKAAVEKMGPAGFPSA